MTYRSIDKRRFTYLLSLGTAEYELRQFFTDCRAQLIQRGGRVQNLPHGDKARIRVLVNELFPSTDDIVREWFSEHLTMSDPELPESLVDTFKLHEEMTEEIEEDTARRLARSCLVHLFSDTPPIALLDFLRTPIGGQAKLQDQTPEPSASEKPFGTDKLAQIMVSLVEGQDVDKYLDGVPPEIATLATGLQAAVQGHLKESLELLDALPLESATRARIEQYIKQQDARTLREPPRGLSVSEFETSNGAFDNDSDEILGYCTKSDPPKAVFIHPLAVVREGAAQLLTNELRRKLFPTTGDVMAFMGVGHPRQPRRGELGVWHVEEHETDKATHFHIAGELRRVYEFISAPFSSTDFDSVREYLKEHTERTASKSLQPLLFGLSDGLIVGGRPDRPDLSKDETFESGLLSWNSLPGVKLEGRLFVVGPLPKEQGIYECASIAASVRKLLRPHIGKSAGLTRAQLTELTQLLESTEIDLNATRLQRIRYELERIVQNQEALEVLTDALMGHPSVHKRLEELVQAEAARQAAEKIQMQGEITRLQKERGEWEERIRKQRDEHRKLREDTSKVVRAAFEKARTDSVATLAELAVFQELTGGTNQRNDSSRGSLSPFQPMVRELAKRDADPIEILRTLGLGKQRASAIAAIGELAFSLGLILCIRGTAARLVVERWAESIGSGILIDSTVGLVDDAPLRVALNGNPRPAVVAVLDANLSAVDIYARPIADAVVDTLSKGDKGSPIAVLFSLSDGVGHLPIPRSVAQLSITIDLEMRYDFKSVDTPDLMLRAFNPDDGVINAQLWGPAAERLRAGISQLPAEKQALVLSVLMSK